MKEEISYQDNHGYKFTREEVLGLVYSKRKKLLFVILIFMILGVLIVMMTPKKYESSVIIVPQINSSPSVNKKYSKIAALAGINLKSSESSSLIPTVYPIIITSTPFRKEVLETPLKINGQNEEVTLSYYLSNLKKTPFIDKVKKYTIGLPGLIISSFKSKPEVVSNTGVIDSTVNWLTAKEVSQFGFLDEAVNMKFNDVDGYLEIVGSMPEPIASAQLTQNVHELLQSYIIKYNVEKSTDELAYIEERLVDAEKEFFEKRAAYGSYVDRNQNLISSFSMNRLEQYKIEYELAYSIYSELSSQLESTKLQVKKDTPIFTIIKPVTVPIEAASKNGLLTLVFFTFIGTMLGLILILFRYSKLFIKNYFSD